MSGFMCKGGEGFENFLNLSEGLLLDAMPRRWLAPCRIDFFVMYSYTRESPSPMQREISAEVTVEERKDRCLDLL